MRIELDISDELVGRVAQAVVDRMRQVQSTSVQSGAVVGDLSRPADPVGRGKEQHGQQRVLLPAGYLRLKDVLSLIPISKSTWWAGVRDGRFPKPTKKFGSRITAWDAKDIQCLLERVAE
jgi:predicted DNA-binding transcriptional regulator AlpA